MIPLAHSARDNSQGPDPYARHVSDTRDGANRNCLEMLRYAHKPRPEISLTVNDAATFHDLGKLDEANQAILNGSATGRLPWDHIDAGVAHTTSFSPMAAWVIRAHHAPGLPNRVKHFNRDDLGRKLRGRRHDDANCDEHDKQRTRTDQNLQEYLALHESVLSPLKIKELATKTCHGLDMRLALSCLVDADHSDTAFFDSGTKPPDQPDPKWELRLEQLKKYVAALPKGDNEAEIERNKVRREFFNSCANHKGIGEMFCCEGPVGIGKTTSLMAFLLNQAIKNNLRRIIIVAPFTNILRQTADRLRKALLLPGEESIAERIIVEQHHRADFSSRDARSMAALWKAPIVLTTSVSFFETLGECHPSSLRKLHSLPGSGVFLDESHAALPAKLWPQCWRWLRELSKNWGCRFVFASGTLTRFWENDSLVKKPVSLPELLLPKQAKTVFATEKRRVTYRSLNDSNVVDLNQLASAILKSPGPRLAIFNTVQNAAVAAKYLKKKKQRVLHLSTALTPNDRAKIYDKIIEMLDDDAETDWTLVATSCVEAGVDFSFRTAFRERFSVSSILQVGGRVNRNSEYNDQGGSEVWDFALSDSQTTQHPAATLSAPILLSMIESGHLNDRSPSVNASEAMESEITKSGGLPKDLLMKAERSNDYPTVKELCKVVDADTRLVVVEQYLIEKIKNREQVSFRELLGGSVQLWAAKINKLRMEPFSNMPEVYSWQDDYDPDFLGYMKGVLARKDFMDGGGGVI